MLRIVILSAFLALAASQEDHHECSTLDRLKVKAQWTIAWGEGDARGDFGLALWKAIFKQAPTARALFKQYLGEEDDLHNPEFEAHSRRVLGGLDQCISLLDDEEVLAATLGHLNSQHTSWGIPSNYFENFMNALLQIVPAQIGRCFNREAWLNCYHVISDGITAH